MPLNPYRCVGRLYWIVPAALALVGVAVLAMQVPRTHATVPPSPPGDPVPVPAVTAHSAVPQLAEALAIVAITNSEPVAQSLAALSADVAEHAAGLAEAMNAVAAAEAELAKALAAARSGSLNPEQLAAKQAAATQATSARAVVMDALLETIAVTLDERSEFAAPEIRAVLDALQSGVPGESGLVGLTPEQREVYAAAIGNIRSGEPLNQQQVSVLDTVDSHHRVITYRITRLPLVPTVRGFMDQWLVAGAQPE